MSREFVGVRVLKDNYENRYKQKVDEKFDDMKGFANCMIGIIDAVVNNSHEPSNKKKVTEIQAILIEFENIHADYKKRMGWDKE